MISFLKTTYFIQNNLFKKTTYFMENNLSKKTYFMKNNVLRSLFKNNLLYAKELIQNSLF